MKTKLGTKVTAAIVLLTVIFSLLVFTVKEPELNMSPHIADAWRIFVMSMAGYNAVITLLMIKCVMDLRIDRSDQLSAPLFTWLLGSFLGQIFIVFVLVARITQPAVGWQTPLAMVVSLVGCVTITILYWRIRILVSKAHGGIIRLTIIDTGRFGPDVDLSTEPKSKEGEPCG